MARRKHSGPPPKPLDPAYRAIDTLEQAVVGRTLCPTFTLRDVAQALWPDDVTAKLFTAFNYTHPSDRTRYSGEILLPVEGATAVGAGVYLNLPAIGMLRPADNLEAPTLNRDRIEPVYKELQAVYRIHSEFEVVRGVVRWCNEHATLGAARHYCPWLLGVMPKDHAIHELDGVVFREPALSMLRINGSMRQAGEIMARALLAEGTEIPRKGDFTVQFTGHRGHPYGIESYTSETFGVL